MKQSNWIWTKEPVDEHRPVVVWFRKELNIKKAVLRLILKVTADTEYRLYMNGISAVAGPVKGDLAVWYYDEVDVVSMMKSGDNILSAVVLRYPQNLSDKRNHSRIRTAMPGLFVSGTIEYQDGTTEEIYGDDSWICKINHNISIGQEGVYYDYIDIAENVTGHVVDHNWKTCCTDQLQQEDWKRAKVYDDARLNKCISPCNLKKRPIPYFIEEPCRFQNVHFVREGDLDIDQWNHMLQHPGKGIFIPPHKRLQIEISAEAEVNGYVEISFSEGKNSKVKMLTSESYVYGMNEAGTHPVKGNRTDAVQGHLEGVIDCYKVAGYGTENKKEVYEPFEYRTFRFVQLTIETEEEGLWIEDFSYRHLYYPLQVVCDFETSDPDLKKIWDISLRTLQNCMLDTYMDCPFYERLQYVMDARAQMLFTYAISMDDRLARKTIDDFARSQRYDGLLASCYPSFTTHSIPGFSIYYLFMLTDHMDYFGDRDFIMRYIPTAMGILSFFDRHLNEQRMVEKLSTQEVGSPYWSYIDWAVEWTNGVPNANRYGSLTMESLLYLAGLQQMQKLCEFAGVGDLKSQYLAKESDLRNAILSSCCVEKEVILDNGTKECIRIFMDGPGVEEYSQQTQIWAVLTNLIDGEEARKLMYYTLFEDSMVKCSVSMKFYLFRALEKTNLYEHTNVLWDSWRDMLAEQLTTTEEDHVNKRSDCHAWGASILYEIPAVVLGAKPIRPGYVAATGCYQTGHLTYARGEVITTDGKHSVEWLKC